MTEELPPHERPVLVDRGSRRQAPAHQPAELALTRLAPCRVQLDDRGAVTASLINTGDAGVGVRVHVWGEAITRGLVEPVDVAIDGNGTLPLAPLPSESGEVVWFAEHVDLPLVVGKLEALIGLNAVAVGAGQLQLAVFAIGQLRPPSYKTQVSVASTGEFRPPRELVDGLTGRLRAMGADPSALADLISGKHNP